MNWAKYNLLSFHKIKTTYLRAEAHFWLLVVQIARQSFPPISFFLICFVFVTSYLTIWICIPLRKQVLNWFRYSRATSSQVPYKYSLERPIQFFGLFFPLSSCNKSCLGICAWSIHWARILFLSIGEWLHVISAGFLFHCSFFFVFCYFVVIKLTSGLSSDTPII